MGSDVAFSMLLSTLVRWVGICIALLIVVSYADGWVLALIGKL